MTTYYSQGSADFSTLANWNDVRGGGGGNPASVAAMDDDIFTIQATHVITMDDSTDMSGFANGIAGLVIEGAASGEPGVLRWYDTKNGYLKIKTACTIAGTNTTVKGRLIANSDGAWATTTALAYTTKAVIELAGTAQIQPQYLDINLRCAEPTNKSVETYGQVFHEATVDAGTNKITFTGMGTALANTMIVRVTAGSGALPAELSADTDYWVVNKGTNDIQLSTSSGGSAIDLSAGGPINVHFGWNSGWTRSSNTLTKTNHGLITNAAIKFHTTGTLPAPLEADRIYWVGTVAANSITVRPYYNSTRDVTLTSDGSGTLSIYTGSTGPVATGGASGGTAICAGSTKVNALTDVTADNWSTTTGHNVVALVNEGPQDYDIQRGLTVSAITATMITLSAAVDSVQFPGARVWLSSRNVSIRSSTSSSGNPIVNYVNTTPGSGHVWGCEIRQTNAANQYGYAINSGSGWTHTGTIHGTSAGMVGSASMTAAGVYICCGSGVSGCAGGTVSGTMVGCNYGLSGSGTLTEFSGTARGCSIVFYAYKWATFSGTSRGCRYCVFYGYSVTISGHVYNSLYAINGSTGCLISGHVIGCSSGINGGSNHTVTGEIEQCIYGLSATAGAVISGTIHDCTYGLDSMTAELHGAAFYDNTNDVILNASVRLTTIIGWASRLSSTSPVQYDLTYGYTCTTLGWEGIWIFDPTDGSDVVYPGRIRAWTQGGQITAVETGDIPDEENAPWNTTDIPYCHKSSLVSQTGGTLTTYYKNFVDIPLVGQKGIPVKVTVWVLRIGAAEWQCEPTAAIIDPQVPWGEAGEELDSDEAPSDTEDTWYELSVSYTPTSNRQLALRVYAKDNGVDFYWQYQVEYDYPAEADVVDSTSYGNGLYTGSYAPDFPDVGNVLSSDTVDGENGTLTLPANGNKILTTESAFGAGGSSITPNYHPATTGEVQKNVAFGSSSGETGTLEGCVDSVGTNNGTTGVLNSGTFSALSLWTLISGVVAAADVRNGAARYSGGSNGTAYIPAAADVRFGTNVDATTGTCYVPAAGDVQDGVNVDNTTGTFTNPALNKVMDDTSWGAGGIEFTGTYAELTSEDLVIEATSWGESGTQYTGTYHPAQASEVQKGVGFGDGSTETGILYGCIDKNGNDQGISGILDADGDYEAAGILDENGVFHSDGMLDVDAVYKGQTGIFIDASTFHATGILYGTTSYHADGVLDGEGNYSALALWTLLSSVVSTLNDNLDEMITDNTSIQAAFTGVNAGTASGGGVNQGLHAIEAGISA